MRCDGFVDVTVLNLAVRQGQDAIVGLRKAGGVGAIADFQWFTGLGRDPQAFGSVLQHHCRTRLIVGNGTLYPDSMSLITHVVSGQYLVHRRDRQRVWTCNRTLQNLHIVKRWKLQHDSCKLHLVVEDSRYNPGDFHFGAKQYFELTGVAAEGHRVNRAAVHEQFQVSAGQILVLHRVRASDRGLNCDQHAVALGADELCKVRFHGLERSAVVKQGDAVAHHIRTEAIARLSPHQHSIAGSQALIWFALHIKGLIALLHKEIKAVVVIVRNRSLEGHGQPLSGLCVGEGAYGVQSGPSAWRSRVGGRGPPEDDGEHKNQSLHREYPVEQVLRRWHWRVLIGSASRINHFRRGIAESRSAGRGHWKWTTSSYSH